MGKIWDARALTDGAPSAGRVSTTCVHSHVTKVNHVLETVSFSANESPQWTIEFNVSGSDGAQACTIVKS